MSFLVEGRVCGECVACCQILPISTEMLEKPTNLLCPHCVPGKGCAVYSERPDPCSGWYCGWRYMAELAERWRPDRSGVVLRIGLERAPPDVTAVIVSGKAAFVSAEFASLIAGWVSNGIEVYFEAVGPVGHLPGKLLVNPHIQEGMANQDLVAVLTKFVDMLEHLRTKHVWKPDGLTMRTALGNSDSEI